MYDDVVIPTDGSEGVNETLVHGLDLSRRHDATVHALHAIDQRQYLGAPEDVQERLRAELERAGEDAVASVEAAATEEGLDVTTRVEEGVPHKTILEYVEGNEVDIVVMGTHGRTGRDRLATLGSVTERVVKHSTVPVFVVRIEE